MQVLGEFEDRTGEPLGVWSLPEHGPPEVTYADPPAEARGRSDLPEAAQGSAWREAARALCKSEPAGRWRIVDVDEAGLDGALEVLRRRWAGTSAATGSPRFQAAARRVRFAAAEALDLADHVLGHDHQPYTPAVRVSGTTVLRLSSDGQRLAVLVQADETDQVDAALAFGLCFQGDRDLILVLPDRLREAGEAPVVEATLRRAAFVVTPVTVFTYGGDRGPVEHVPPARIEARRATRQDEQIPYAEHDLRDRAGWVAELMAAADADPELRPAHRSSYLAWHAAGRQVLRIKRSRAGLNLVAGVNYSQDRPDRPTPVRLALDEAPTAEEKEAVLTAVARAVADRKAGTDAENLEHQLQDVLATPAGQAALGLVGQPLREVPATRPGQRRAYTDLLGVDGHGHVHLIETKLGLDEMLGLQGLDYWVWLQEHAADVVALARERGLDVADKPRLYLDYIVGARDGSSAADMRYLAPQLESLDGAIAWRIGIVSNWLTPESSPTVDWLPRRQTPKEVDGRAEPPRFALQLQSHLTAQAHDLHRGVFHPDPVEATVAAAREVTRDLLARGLGHRYLAHVRSSQLWAINLFGGLTSEQTVAVARQLDPTIVAADRPVFEFQDVHDRLAEATHASPHSTQVDVLIRTTRGDGRAAGAVVFAVENEALLSWAWRTGVAAPVVWSSGTDAAARLLAACGRAGWTVAVSADFEQGGLARAATLLARVPGAVPWRLTAADYLAAVADGAVSGLQLSARAASTPWDPQLADVLADRGVRVTEEDRWETLTADLRRGVLQP